MDGIKGQRWVYCAVANLIDNEQGTKHFLPNARLYLHPIRFGDGGERVEVLGQHRKGRRWIRVILPSKLLTNARVRQVYNPTLLYKLKGYCDNTTRSKEQAEQWVATLQQNNQNPSTAKE